ncbi:uncharacterized protein Bfra_007545 [Botrytis fragariae]|uniref:Uncharacterized protein n=1 Tax=Botrytis fragariae TaxID=1964551 RepID=A0A8H6AJ55_9HELO|nr:uncharacterized protein Bfra_007545 [Botrytis fragariae]KAF5868347.1 hypothetical protein Bfra_007545 [Botrytis fragariae]
MDGSMTSDQQVQDNQKFLEQVYLHPLTQYQSSNYVDPSHVMYDSQHSRWIDPSVEVLEQICQRDGGLNYPLSDEDNPRSLYPEVPDPNASTEPYYVHSGLNRTDIPALAQQTNPEASVAPSDSAAGQSVAVNNYNHNHNTTMGDESHESQNLVDRNMQNTQTEDMNADAQSDTSDSEAPETRKSKNKGATQRKRRPWTTRTEFNYPRVWMTEQEMKIIDPEYEKNPRLAFKDMTNAKNGMKSFQINWDQVELLNEHRRNVAHEENERMKRSAPGTYVQKFIPKPYCPNGRLRECRDEWLRRKQTGEVSDSWTNRMRRTADHRRYNPEFEDTIAVEKNYVISLKEVEKPHIKRCDPEGNREE